MRVMLTSCGLETEKITAEFLEMLGKPAAGAKALFIPTAAIDADGWYHSGDLATVDGEGYFHITGRIKDMIIRGGENIYPKELEEFLYTHPKVKDVQVIGVPDANYGEEVCACIILRDDVKENENAEDLQAEFMEYVRANISRHKKPRYIWFMDSFPMTASGKIQKFKMREMAVHHLNLGEAAKIETA